NGIASTVPTTAPAAGVPNLLPNGRLVGKEDMLAGWQGQPLGAVTTLAQSGIALSGAMGDPGRLRSDPVPVEAGRGYLLRVRYKALEEAYVRLAASFLDAAGATLSSVET